MLPYLGCAQATCHTGPSWLKEGRKEMESIISALAEEWSSLTPIAYKCLLM